MAKVVTFGIQKGGVGKSTTSGIISYLLAKDGYRVLVVDMDSQGNVSDLLLQMEPEEFEDKTILEAFAEEDIEPYILEASENLHVVPSDDYLAQLAKLFYTVLKPKDPSMSLRKLLKPIQDRYDYIIIDTPPSLSEPMINAVCASDYVVIMAESSKWAFTAIKRFRATIEAASDQKGLDIKIAGILRTMNDSRRADSKAFVELIEDVYPELVFDTVIKRKASTGRIALEGLFENKELKEALEQYYDFYKEFKIRVGVNENVKG